MNEAVIAAVLAAIAQVESGSNHKAINVADGGSASYGKYQVKMATARSLGFKGEVLELWLNEKTNQKYARAYLLRQLKRYGDLSKAIAAYNAGSYRLTSSGHPVNQRYVDKVLRSIRWRR